MDATMQQDMPLISSRGGADTTRCYNIWQGASISAKTIFCKSSIYDAPADFS